MICPVCRTRFARRAWPATRHIYCSSRCMKHAYYLRHKPALDARARRWCREHRELRLEVQRRWNASAQAKASKRAWAKRNYARPYAQWKREGTLKFVYARVTSRRRLLRSQPNGRCACAPPHEGKLECHHKDGNPLNTALSNLEWRCFFHHRSGHGKLRRPQPQLGVRGSSHPREQRSGRP